eukprot:gene21344-25650_t
MWSNVLDDMDSLRSPGTYKAVCKILGNSKQTELAHKTLRSIKRGEVYLDILGELWKQTLMKFFLKSLHKDTRDRNPSDGKE